MPETVPPAAPPTTDRDRSRGLSRFRAELGRWRIRDWLMLALFAPLALGLGLLVSDSVRLRGHVWPGVSVGGETVGGYSEAALIAVLERRAAQLQARSFRVRVKRKVFSATASELGIALDVEATRAAGLQYGREAAWPDQIAKRVRHAFGAVAEVALLFAVDEERFESLAARWEKSALSAPVEGRIVLKRRRFVGRWPAPGGKLDRELLRERLLAALGDSSDAPVVAPVVEVSTRLDRAAVEAAVAQATQLTASPLRLVHPDAPERVVSWSQTSLRKALRSERNEATASLDLKFELEPLLSAIAKERAAVELTPKDASFEVNYRGVIKILPSETGTQIDEAKLPELLRELAASGKRQGILPLLREVSPKLTTADAESQGIKKLVATFTTTHPCCQARVKNIHRIAAILNGVVVRSNETFSVNDFVGPRTTSNGFVPAPTIVRGVIEDTVGGGVSQFATTFFNAVLRGGYEIIERQPHSYYFSRYPAGHEATLSFPKPDFIFRNDTEHGLLIKTEYGGTYIRVKLYGDIEGRVVKQVKGTRYAFTEPKIVYEVDDGLAPEEAVVRERGQRGFKIPVSRTVTFADGTKKEEKRIVKYESRERVVAVHSCKIPEGEEGYTGEECPEPECDPETEACGMPCAPDDKACIIQRSLSWWPSREGKEKQAAQE